MHPKSFRKELQQKSASKTTIMSQLQSRASSSMDWEKWVVKEMGKVDVCNSDAAGSRQILRTTTKIKLLSVCIKCTNTLSPKKDIA